MTQPECERCGRPVADMAYVCATCGTKVADMLKRAALVAGEAIVTIAKLARISSGGRRTDTEAPLPVNLGAGRDHDAAVNTLTTWARHVHEESGRPLPTVRIPSLACQHATCRSVRRHEAPGPACARRPPAEHPAAVLLLWLAGQVDWLRHRKEGLAALDEIEDAASVLIRVVDRAPDRIIVGQCECGEYLYAVRGSDTVACRSCEVRYDVETTRQMMREHLDQKLFTAAEIALLVMYLGITGKRDALRHKIVVWAGRGVVATHSNLRGEPAYRFGDVAARLMAG